MGVYVGLSTGDSSYNRFNDKLCVENLLKKKKKTFQKVERFYDFFLQLGQIPAEILTKIVTFVIQTIFTV